MRSLGLFLALGLGLSLTGNAQARDLFEGRFTTTDPISGVTQSASAGRNNVLDFADLFTDAGLKSTLSGYTPISAATASVSLRGVPATLSYAANSPVLRLQIPSIGIDRSFNGATRDQSQDLAVEWLRGGGGAELTRFLKEAVATTPVDPVAGNPNSLMSQMGASDFNVATGGGFTAGGRSDVAGGGRFDLGARFGRYTADGFDTNVYTLPLGYSYGLNNGMRLIIDAPLTLLSTSGAQSYSGSVGVGLRIPISVNLPESLSWALIPMMRAGGVGSVELGAVGGLWSASLTSALDWRAREGTTFTLANMASRLETMSVTISDFGISYDLTNYMFRNGLIATQRLGELAGRQVSGSLFAVDTRFTGDDLYVKAYQEYGGYLTFGDPVTVAGMRVPIRLGATFTQGDNGYRGFSANLGFTF
jgi:hypothetical protein